MLPVVVAVSADGFLDVESGTTTQAGRIRRLAVERARGLVGDQIRSALAVAAADLGTSWRSAKGGTIRGWREALACVR